MPPVRLYFRHQIIDAGGLPSGVNGYVLMPNIQTGYKGNISSHYRLFFFHFFHLLISLTFEQWKKSIETVDAAAKYAPFLSKPILNWRDTVWMGSTKAISAVNSVLDSSPPKKPWLSITRQSMGSYQRL